MNRPLTPPAAQPSTPSPDLPPLPAPRTARPARSLRLASRGWQSGLSRPLSLLAVAAVAALGAGGWWVWQGRPAGEAQGTAQGAASAAAPGASGARGPGGARRFGGANRVQPVTVGQVRRQDIRVTVNAIGNIAALNTAVVRARVDGELKALRFREGQMVRAGQVLAEIDPRAFEVALAQAQAQHARDSAQLRNARLDLDRYKDLLTKDSIARQQVDTQEALVRQLEATVQADQASVDSAKLQLSYTRVTAPISGRLGLKQVDMGNIVRASDANGIVSITQTQPISLVFAVPEANLAQLNRKLRKNEPMTVEAWDREQRNLLAQGKVSTIDNAIDTATGTIKVKAEFPNADGALFPNQFVNIRLQLDTQTDALAVPATAIQRGAIGIFVYVVRDDGTVTVRRVRPGAADGAWISVQGELSPGEKVVTDGADRLREGAKVEVIVPQQRPGGRPGMGGAGGAGAGAGAGVGGAVAGAPGSGGTPPAPAPGTAGVVVPDAGARAGAGTGAGAGERTAGSTRAGQGAAAQPGTANGGNTPTAEGAGSRPGASSGGAGAGRPAAPGAGAGAGPMGAGQDWTVPGTRPPWLDRLPPDVQERFMKMNQEERRVFLERLRERRRAAQQSGGEN